RRDVRMVKRREQLRFAFKPCQPVCMQVETLGKRFDRYLAVEPGVFRLPDGAHASGPKHRQYLVMSQLPAHHRPCLIGECLRNPRESWRFNEAVGLFVRLEECVYFPAQLFVARTCLVEECGAPARVELERLAQQLVDVLPALRPHSSASMQTDPFGAKS